MRHNGEGSGCDGYCDQRWECPEPLSFYSLGPGESIDAHVGPSNQRLKCHLAVRAANPVIMVGEENLTYQTGDVFCFDDSYRHWVSNKANTSRVVFDVTFWHRRLLQLDAQ